MLKKWLPSLIGLSVLALLGRLLGLAREVLMASKFGATEITDAYLTTLLLFDIAIAANTSILAGTLSYSTEIKNAKDFLKSLYNTGWKIFAALFVVSLILYPISDRLIPLVFSKSSEATQIVIETSRLLFILVAFLAASGIFSALLQIKGNLTNPGKLIVFLNIGSVGFLIIFSQSIGIISLPLGLLLGGILFFAYQLFLLRKIKYQQINNHDKNEFNLFNLGMVIILVFGNSLLPSLSGLIERYFAYSFPEGTFSHYQYAIKIILLPLTIFSFAISTSLLPIQTNSINNGNEKEFIDVTNNGILISVLTSSFFVILFSVLSQPIIQLIYQHGHFTQHDSFETSHALEILSIGLIAFLLTPVIANIFYSFRIVKNLIVINLFFIFIQFVILYFLSKFLPGIEILTITWVIFCWTNICALIFYLKRKKYLKLNLTIIRQIALILLITSAIIIFSKSIGSALFADNFTSQDSWSVLIRLIYSGFILLTVFSLAAYFIFRKTIGKIISNMKSTNQ